MIQLQFNECPWLGIVMTLLVAEKLGIPFQTVDLSEQYQEKNRRLHVQ
jgi:tRNA-specific 2-thiouridylase